MTATPERKSRFAWASIGGAEPEPVELTELEGHPVAYTCGCADVFFLDEPDSPVRIGGTRRLSGWLDLCMDFKAKNEIIERPRLADKEETARLNEQYHRREPKRHHGWRGPR